MGDITVLKTSRFNEADMLAEALRDAGVPYYQEAAGIGGVRYAMFPLPEHGPGQFYHILVPEEVAEEARAVMEKLPLMAEINCEDVAMSLTDESLNRLFMVMITTALILSCLGIFGKALGSYIG